MAASMHALEALPYSHRRPRINVSALVGPFANWCVSGRHAGSTWSVQKAVIGSHRGVAPAVTICAHAMQANRPVRRVSRVLGAAFWHIDLAVNGVVCGPKEQEVCNPRALALIVLSRSLLRIPCTYCGQGWLACDGWIKRSVAGMGGFRHPSRSLPSRANGMRTSPANIPRLLQVITCCLTSFHWPSSGMTER
jgi:hypothetical protein